ncbi:phosphonate metabolism protein/1,5-bisphosphokinase (PRPP-forming) PhnN [Aliiroseovarius sp.]|uniref:phosphonate metabolism protein/1,5-bisphosphokinase (PRPP-forming) PhnN n=1 Tax=Aliiroseovarius sp. TaxID=1872442 RepID=UPI003BA8B471
MTGCFIAVVGPSGVGKDTLMEAAAAQTDMVLARRVITRPSEAGGEDFDGVSEAEFDRRLAAGGFALHWPAHGLRYAIPAEIDTVLAQGRNVLANLSRAVLPQLASRFEHHRIVLLTAAPEVLAARLAARGRESEEDITRRLKRASFQLEQDLKPVVVENNGTLDQAIADFIRACQPVRA